ncbi:MAG: cupin [Candidatus Eisenbacteria bacterium RBG_16_71_46]|nr:MAG: cupin [Candidatus Eisenbacteria bacterium RBG_16_71_46]OGF25475.1 MAG: cupin [Candidatus Eisenbacteria bacterium RBG_19FT_COMBO_70_11]
MPEATPNAAPAPLVGLVAYQEGSVVSRVILKRPTGTVTVFAFAQGEGLSEHTAPFEALVHVLEGRADVSVGGASHAVEPGEFLVLPANVPHALHARERFKMVLTMIRS